MKTYRVLALVLVVLLLVTATAAGAKTPPPIQECGVTMSQPAWWHCTVNGAPGYKIDRGNCYPKPPMANNVFGDVNGSGSCNGRSYKKIVSGMWSGYWVPSGYVTCHWHD